VQRQHHRYPQLKQLKCQVQIPLNVGGIHNVDDAVRLLVEDKVTGDDFLLCIGPYNLPNQLSGGQQQRVAIARALVNRPEIIFADEPTGNLDSKTSDEVIALLKMTAKKYGQTIVMITHDDEIAQVADRILVIEDGQVVDFR
ncbi:ABC-type antimicrobial peptide transport system, ATPase component, partial [human gut metagenome]